MSLKVLIVDNEEEFASTLCERLILRHYDAKAVYESQEAISTILEWKPDVVLLDLTMSWSGGQEVIQAIRKLNPKIKVIAVTGLSVEQIEARGVTLLSVFDYLPKPINIEELMRKIDQ